MAPSFVSAVLKGSALLAAVNAQNFDGGSRGEDAFEYVQPVNTTILTEYGSSPAVYPSRKLSFITLSMLVSDLTLYSKHHWRRWLGDGP
jgi:hypothetical protein